jgi:hypothetical protein
MSEINYSVSRLEPKEAVETTAGHDAGNICNVVIGVTATSGAYSAYVDGVTGCLNMPKEDYEDEIGGIVNSFIAANGWKESLKGQIAAQVKKPISADVQNPSIDIN